MRSYDRFLHCAPAFDHLLTPSTPLLARRPPSALAPPHSKPQYCLNPPQHPPQSSFPTHKPSTSAPSYGIRRYKMTSSPHSHDCIAHIHPRIPPYTPHVSVSCPQKYHPQPPQRSPCHSCHNHFTRQQRQNAVPANISAVARPQYACFGYMPACMCLKGLRCRNWRAESLQPIGCSGSARHPRTGALLYEKGFFSREPPLSHAL